MKLPHHLAALALGSALFASALVQSAQAQMKIVPLSADNVDKMGKFVQSVNDDLAKKAAIKESDEAFTIEVIATGGSINDVVNTKYPRAAAIYQAAGYTPDEYLAMLMSVVVASKGSIAGTNDRTVAKANVEFYRANKVKIDKLLESMSK